MAVAEMNAYLKGTMGRFANNAVSKAWNRWMEALEERYAMRRFVKRMINSGMARAFSEWLSMADQAKHDARQLKKFGTRMMRVKEVQCFNKMCARSRAMAHAMAHARSSGAAVANGTWHMAPGTCFLPLASTVVSCAPSSCTPPPTALPLAPPTLARRYGLVQEARKLRNFARRMANNGLGKGFNTWIEFIDGQNRLLGIMGRAANGPALKAFNRWLEALGEIAKMRGVLGRVVDGRASRAFNRWVEACEENGRLAAFGSKMANHQLLKAWNQWDGLTTEWRRLKAFGQRMLHLGLTKAVNSWVEFIEERKRLQAFGHRLMNRGLTKAINSWYEEADKVRRMRGVAMRASLLAARMLFLSEMSSLRSTFIHKTLIFDVFSNELTLQQ